MKKSIPSSSNTQVIKTEIALFTDVVLVEGKGASGLLGEHGGKYWHVYYKGIRVGRGFIKLIKSDINELHPYITLELGKKFRGIGIGTIAFQKVCKMSGYAKVFADVRKSNIPSRLALTHAGFKEIQVTKSKQIVLAWTD